MDNDALGSNASAGGVYADSIYRLEGVVLADNTADGAAPNLFATTIDQGGVDYSLIGDTSGSPIDAGAGVGNLLNVAPLLGPLADNGGPTRTHLPLPDSPLVNAGNPSRDTAPFDPFFDVTPPELIAGVFDQRGAGYPRVTDGGDPGNTRIDIGATEFPGETTPVNLPRLLTGWQEEPKGTDGATHDQAVLGFDEPDELLLLVESEPDGDRDEAVDQWLVNPSSDDEEPISALDAALADYRQVH